MSEHDKMVSDYIWVKDHASADSGPQPRTHGQHYLYYRTPNSSERLEMTWRSLGRQYDWELEKFRCAKKPVDQGNKRRIFKNAFRFIKNPGGYIYWKTFKFREHRGRFIQLGMGMMIFSLFVYGKNQNDRNMHILNTRLRIGENPEGTGSESFGYNQGRAAYLNVPLYAWMQQDFDPTKVRISPAKDQVFRKHFEMRKRKGIPEGEFI